MLLMQPCKPALGALSPTWPQFLTQHGKALLSGSGVNLVHNIYSNSAGLVAGWSKAGIPEGQLDVCWLP